MIDTKMIDLNLKDFTIGRMTGYPERDLLFLVDTLHLHLLPMKITAVPQLGERLNLKEKAPIQQIDFIFFDASLERLIIADSLAKKLFAFKCEGLESHLVSFTLEKAEPLNPGTIIVAAVVLESEYLLLDKGNSMIRAYNKALTEIYTLGSRMGYISEYADKQSTRLGFEFPEDMMVAVDGSRLLVVDSGNKRLVLIQRERRQNPERRSEMRWIQEKILPLPEYPYKLLAWNPETQDILVSDFATSWLRVSLVHGFVSIEALPVQVDFYPGSFLFRNHEGVTLLYCVTENNSLVAVRLPNTTLEECARQDGNWSVLIKLFLEAQRMPEARQLLIRYPELITEYMKYGPAGDHEVKEMVHTFVNTTFWEAQKANEPLKEELMQLARQFIVKYKSIPTSPDLEAAHIDKENIRHRMFLKLKQFRIHLYKIAELRILVKHYDEAYSLLNDWLTERFEQVKTGLLREAERIEKNLLCFDELDILHAIVEYWLLSEEEGVVFSERQFTYPKIFSGNFLLAILKDFYYHIGILFLQRGKIEEYIQFIDREISMYTDKVGIFNAFIKQLIRLQKYDDVLRMLNKLPDRNKENVNYFQYQVSLGQGDKDKAFMFLKKELELYPHRVDLIPNLMELGKLSAAETQGFIDKILATSGLSIDLHLNAARAYQCIGNYEQMEFYVDRELELFPENKSALLLKVECYLRHQSEVMPETYYRTTWGILKRFLFLPGVTKSNDAEMMLVLYDVLNYIKIDTEDINQLLSLKDKVVGERFQLELKIFLSFWRYYRAPEETNPALDTLEKYSPEIYLTAYSTRHLAFEYFLVAADTAKNNNDYENMLLLIKLILKTNPGHPRVLVWLDVLMKEKSE